MKKLYITFVFPLMISLCSVPAYASDWSTPYDMPRVAYDVSAFDIFKTSIKTSLGSMSSTGIVILGIVLSVMLIASIFLRLLLDKLKLFEGVWHREFNRKVSALDRKRNLNEIVDDRVSEMEVSFLAKNRFRLTHSGVDLNEKIYQREIAYQADLAIREAHPERAFEESVFRRELSAQAGIEFHLRDPELATRSGVARREENHEAEGMFRMRNPWHVTERGIDNRFLADEAREQYAERFPERQRRSRRSHYRK